MTRFITPICISAIALLSSAVLAQTDTSFTYQGELKESGAPASGSYNIDVSLWNAPSGGNQIGSTIMFNALAVTDGLFTVELDFGAGAFDNTARWLEISVNGSELTPRQPITRAPYAIQTRGIFVDENNNVGIGTTTPTQKLDVHGLMAVTDPGSSPLGSVITFGSPTTNIGITMERGDGAGGQVRRWDYLIASDASLRFQDRTFGRDRLVIDTSGNVGIGTTEPAALLDLHGTQPTLRLDHSVGVDSFSEVKDATSSQLRINKTNGAGSVLLDLNPKATDGTSDVQIRFFRETNTTGPKNVQFLRGNFSTQASARIGVDGQDSFFQAHGGNLGIGTTTPFHPLHVVGNDFETIWAANTHGTQGIAVLGRADGTLGVGLYGIATANSNLSVGVRGSTNSPVGYDFYATGAGINYGASSSRRWKENIAPIADPLNKIAQLRGVYFDWDKEHGGHHDVGMIAEEVGAVLPEIVNFEENGIDAHGMDYSKLTPLLVEAVNALRAEKDAEIARQQAEIVDLTNRLERMEAMLKRLTGVDKE